MFWWKPNLNLTHTHARTPWAQQWSSSPFAGLRALSPVLHPAADQLVRDHHVQQEDEHGGIHSAARAAGWQPAGANKNGPDEDEQHRAADVAGWRSRAGWWLMMVIRRRGSSCPPNFRHSGREKQAVAAAVGARAPPIITHHPSRSSVRRREAKISLCLTDNRWKSRWQQ